MPHTLFRSAMATLFALALASPALSQSDEQKAAIATVYKMSQESKSIDEFTAMIDECQRLLETELSKSYQDYIKKLASWAYNRRGELRSEEAAAQAGADGADAAAQLDAQAMEDFNASLQLDATRYKAFHNR